MAVEEGKGAFSLATQQGVLFDIHAPTSDIILTELQFNAGTADARQYSLYCKRTTALLQVVTPISMQREDWDPIAENVTLLPEYPAGRFCVKREMERRSSAGGGGGNGVIVWILLPEEVWAVVFGYCTMSERLNAALVCKKWLHFTSTTLHTLSLPSSFFRSATMNDTDSLRYKVGMLRKRFRGARVLAVPQDDVVRFLHGTGAFARFDVVQMAVEEGKVCLWSVF
eukprot:TRINITY_DN1414_c0_g1_i2.p1 TRINITY_DN1414_c0_g1~~TRINITY_DN1414_c0_g1_i2.p1  ORF type:complete len:226 (-),score=30.54 TRINITY_DN1414_c0_g1_i2:111-788(-)